MALVRRSTSCTMQPLPDNLSRRQRDDYLQSIFAADLRSAVALIDKLKTQTTELHLTKGHAIAPRSVAFEQRRRQSR